MKLAQHLDLGAAAPLKQALLEARGRPLVLDASDVERVGALCLQVLLAAKTMWMNDGDDFRIVAPSPGFLEGARLMMGEDRLAAEGA